MSILTKVLIVLLSLFAIFLCGTVATYVGSANNYKASYEQQKSLNNSIKAESANIRQVINEKTAQAKSRQAGLNKKIRQLQEDNTNLRVELRKSQRTSLEYQGRVNSWAGVLSSFEQTIANMEQSLKLTQKQLDKTRFENIADRKKLNETTSSLVEKIVQLRSLEMDKRRLLEENLGLEDQVNQLLETDVPLEIGITAVTLQPAQARPATAWAGIALKGLITEVGASLITLSIGSADGVKEGMMFHVTRGDEFICDMVVTDVDINKAAGTVELVQQRPIIGDNLSTSL